MPHLRLDESSMIGDGGQSQPPATISPTPYKYRPLQDNQIRVLAVDFTNNQSWSIHHITLDRNQSYNAVSYTWGEPTLGPLPVVSVEGRIVEAGASTVDALSSATRLQPQVPVWIDAICINQRDQDEKAKQIPLMGKVYSQASSVLIILPSPPPSEAAFPLPQEPHLDLSNVVRDMSDLDTGGKKSHLQLERTMTTSMIRASFSINDLLTQRWWNRLWTFQEYVLAENPVFLYGDSRIENATLVCYVQLYKNLNLVEAEALMSPAAFRDISGKAGQEFRDQPRGEEQDATTVLLSLQDHRERLVRNQSVTDPDVKFDADMDVLTSTFRRDASDPCDKIFGLLGVLKSDPLCGMGELIGRSQREVYTAVARRVLSSNTTGPRRFSLLHHIDTTTRLESVPSWVPNFDSRGCAIPLDPRQRSGTYLFGASDSVSAECEEVLGPDGCFTGVLRIRAIVLDEIDGTVDDKTYRWDLHPNPTRFSSAPAQLAFEEKCRQHAASVARRHLSSAEQLESSALAYCATLVAGSRREGHATSTSSSYIPWGPPLETYRSWRRRIKTMADPEYDFLNMGMNPGSHVSMPASTHLGAHKVGDDAFQFHQRFYEACAGRLFFSTAKGRLGLGPTKAFKGDLVVLLCGATTPFIVREVQNNVVVPNEAATTNRASTTFHFVGEAYVHGIMNGEAFEDVDVAEEVRWLLFS